jgi:predicted glycogen debranching enzyme
MRASGGDWLEPDEVPAVPGENEKWQTVQHVESVAVGKSYFASFSSRGLFGDATLLLERYTERDRQVRAEIRFLVPTPDDLIPGPAMVGPNPKADDIILLTNGIGGMARICVDLGRVKSKYDCVLGANLHPNLPVDRHIFVKRLRVWVNANGFITPLDYQNLAAFDPGSPAVWYFIANAGDGHTVEIEMRAEMVEGRNTTQFHFSRPTEALATGKQLPADADVRLTVRTDIEDRSFHSETKRNSGAEYHFSTNTHPLDILKPKAENLSITGFAFTPAKDRQLRVFADGGEYHPQPEWCDSISHPIEQSRGQVGSGDAYSPGWFELPLPKGAGVNLTVTAEQSETLESKWQLESPRGGENFEAELLHAARAYVVRRDGGKTVIAGYPWFLDWGRDTFISARGLLAAGMVEEVKQILVTFARFEKDGTLPNTIFGNDASNRDTSDAPLWFGMVCEELAELCRLSDSDAAAHKFYNTRVDDAGRTIRNVLESIAINYVRGTPNGIHMDKDSALIWSPSHFTWMDTNYPAGTPREGYPVEIQALWIRLLRQLASLSDGNERSKWIKLAERALASVEALFWIEDKGWYADVLLGGSRVSARDATPSDALRNNCLFLTSLGLITGERAKRCVDAALRYLVVPGALRSLAPLPLSVPLPVNANSGGLLNDPRNPYWPRYEGDEDTRRKPAYHNGTAWTWTFPVFCEALVRAWNFAPEAVAAAKAYIGSMKQLMNQGCLGQIPEILDGDAPHTQRGCDAQAWGVTEALRVWKLLKHS